MRNKLTTWIILVSAIFALLQVSARAEMIRELVTVQNAIPIPVFGTGIVSGLPNTGDKNQAALEMLRNYLEQNGGVAELSTLTAGSVALVRVQGVIEPFTNPGSKFTITVSTAGGDAKSLAGGVLEYCSLYSGSGELMAQAYGPVTVGAKSLTRGYISNGALQVVPNEPIMDILNSNNILRLTLINSNWNDATNIARQINQNPALNPYLQDASMFSEPTASREVAFANDAGQVWVHVPPEYREKRKLTPYIAAILRVPVAIDRPARIVVNSSTNTIVVTGDIQVNNATVSLQDKTVTIRPETPERPAGYTLDNDTPRTLVELDGPGSYADLQSLIDTLNAMGLTTDQIITIFRQLHEAKAIHAELIEL